MKRLFVFLLLLQALTLPISARSVHENTLKDDEFLSRTSASAPSNIIVGQVDRDCTDCPEMVPVTIEIDGKQRNLMVARYELTWKEYLISYDKAKCPEPRNGLRPRSDFIVSNLRDNYPMTSISPNDFQCYLSWIGKLTGKAYRLPTETEWIAIAKKSSGKAHLKIDDIPCGEAHFPGFCQYSASYSRAAPDALYDPRSSVRLLIEKVGMRKPDSLGLYDLFGNAGELVSDRESFIGNLIVDGVRQVEINVKFKGLNCYWKDEKLFDLIDGYCKYLSRDIRHSSGFRIVYDLIEK